jgi:hypothetical protein
MYLTYGNGGEQPGLGSVTFTSDPTQVGAYYFQSPNIYAVNIPGAAMWANSGTFSSTIFLDVQHESDINAPISCDLANDGTLTCSERDGPQFHLFYDCQLNDGKDYLVIRDNSEFDCFAPHPGIIFGLKAVSIPS